MFIDQFGLGNIMMPVQRYQPFDAGMNQRQGQVMRSPTPVNNGAPPMNVPYLSGSGAIASGTSPSMPPGWSTPPFNPNGTPPPTNTPPTTVSGPVTPGGMPEPAATPPAEPVTVDEQGNVVTAEKLDFGPGIIKLKEGPSRGDRMQAGFMMLSAAGQSNFANVAATVNAGLNQKQIMADQYNQAALGLTRPNIEQARDKDGRIIRIINPATHSYDPETNTVREIPGASTQKPKIEVLYDPTKPNQNRTMYKDVRGLQRWQDTNELVNPDEAARLDRDVARGGLTPKDAQAQFKEQTAVLQDMKKNYNILQRTLYDTENPFSDVATLFSFMKTADPGSVVRPSEADMFSGAGSLGTMVANYMNKLAEGQTLTNEQQMQLAKVVDDLMLGQIQDVEAARANWEEYFGLPDQVADNWSADILNTVDPLYGTSMADDVRGRLEGGVYNITSVNNAPPPPPTDDELEEEAQKILRTRSNSLGGRP